MFTLGALGLIGGGFAFWLLARSIAQPLSEAIHIAETVASGDLSQEFGTERGGDFGRLLGAMGSMEDILTDLVTRWRNGPGVCNRWSASSSSMPTAARRCCRPDERLTRRSELAAPSKTCP